MKKWILLIISISVFAGVAGAIPNPSAVYCILQGYEYEIRTDEQGNQYGVCVFPDGSECGAWAYYCKCEPNACSPGNFTCHWPCKEMRCKEAGESVLVSTCCEGLDEIYPSHIFDTNCNKLALVGWLFLCSDCGNGICENWESRCNCPADCAQPRIIYVDADANGANDGSSWADAFKYLQDALAEANLGDEIWVAQGIYTPDSNSADPNGSADRMATFKLINGVTLKGGYAGFGERDPNARDIDENKTILSGDLDGNDVDVNDPADLLDEPTRAENSYHVVTGSVNAILDGFTITAGNANGFPSHWGGGGMWNESGSPTVTNCTFSSNSASSGGGMNNYGSSPTLTNCTFSGNSARSRGGGIYNYGSSMMINCTFSGNSANDGGGMFIVYDSIPNVANCTFSANSAHQRGGAIYHGTGPPPICHGLRPIITNCIFWGNTPYEIYDSYLNNKGLLITYSDVQGGWPGTGNINSEPFFADATNRDYHLKSQAGRWDANSKTWIRDDVNSPCIDAGAPDSDWTAELWPHGKRINMGAYGGTPQASMSPLTDLGYIADLNNDDKVDFGDLKLFTNEWQNEQLLLSEDLDRNGFVDFKDFAIFGLQWSHPSASEPGITYQIEKCEPNSFRSLATNQAIETRFSVTVEGLYIHFKDMMVANCCTEELGLEMTVEENLITIYEIEYIPGVCFCICDYPVTATLGPFEPGTYILEVYEDWGGFIGSTAITIGSDE